MFNIYSRLGLLTIGLLFVGCERSSLSPVEIKIDDDSGYTHVDAAVSASTLMTTHVVKNDETLFDIAYKYNIDPMNLAKVNGIKAPYNIRNGQILKLPTGDGPVAENEMLDYNESGVKSEKQEKQLDDEFAGVMATKGGFEGKAVEEKTVSETGTSFNEQAAALSVPKVTKTATGAVVPPKKEALTSVAAAQPSRFIKPADGKIISKFGDMQDGIPNDGINIQAPLGSNVKAAGSGKVIYAGNKLEEEFGNVVIVQHDNGLITSYAHLDKIAKKNGALVRAGDVIGTVGKTGDVKSPQLHFEVMKNKQPVDPMKYIK